MELIEEVKRIIKDALVLGDEVDSLTQDSPLLGAFRELDSVGVMAIVESIEEQYDLEIDDTEISPEMFETLGALVKTIEIKLD